MKQGIAQSERRYEVKPAFAAMSTDLPCYHQTGFLMREQVIMHALVAPPSVPVGRIKSFGPLGPKYQIGQAVRQLDDGDWLVEITLVETGETAEYRLTRLLDDPEAC